MAILKKMIITALPLLLTGCREDIEPIIDTKPVLCLNSLITAGEPIEVSVTHTWTLTDTIGEKNHSVRDAEIHIYANGDLVGEDYIAQEGDNIRIEAHSNTYGAALAEVTVPVATSITEINYNPTIKNYWYADNGEWGLSLDLTFDISATISIPNDPRSNQFYILGFTKFSPADEEDSETYANFVATDKLRRIVTMPSDVHFYEGSINLKDPFFSEFIGAFDAIMDWADTSATFFSNYQFEGTKQDLHLDFQDCSFRINQWDGNPELMNCGYIFTLYSISESYIKWLNYRWQSNQSIIGEIIDFGLAEPIWGYSNVSTGAGVVAAQSSATATLNLKKFLFDYISEESK